MNREIKEFFNNNGIIIKKITIKGNVYIIETQDNNKMVVKRRTNDINSLYKYLSNRAFNYYPDLMYQTENYDIFEYIDEVDMDINEKTQDIIKLLSLLHSKTTFYRDIDDDDYKKLYEDIVDKLGYLTNYYEDILNVIEMDEYMSPSNYLFARNSTKLFQAINYSRENIEKWHDLIQDKKRIRVVNLHNNLSLNHFLDGAKPALISWGESRKDMPIYDLVDLYKEYYDKLDFCDLFRTYEKNYPLLPEEKILFKVLISIPEKLEFNEKEYNMCIKVKKFNNYIITTDKFIYDYSPKETTNS